MVVAVGGAFGEIAFRGGPVSVCDIAGVQVHVGAGHLGLVLAGQRDLQSPAQRAGPLSASGAHGTRLAVEGVAEHFGQAQRPGDRLCPPRQLDRIGVGAAHHPHRRQAGVRPGQLDGRAQRLEKRYRGPGGGDSLTTPAQ